MESFKDICMEHAPSLINVLKNKEMFHGKQGVIYITCKERDD